MANIAQQRAVHVDRHLTNVALDYTPRGFIADQIFPVVGVPNETGSYVIFDQADMFRQEDTKRSRLADANTIAYSVSSAGYVCKNYALRDGLSLEDQLNSDDAYMLKREEGMVRRLTTKLMLDWDVRVANQVTSTSNVGTSSAVTSAWTDYTNSDPLGDLWTMIDNIYDATGYRPNKAVFGESAWRNFSRNAEVIGKVNQAGFSGGALPATQVQAAQLLELDSILVGRGYQNTAAEGQPLSLSQIWGDNVLIYFAPDVAAIDDPSFAYSFRWNVPGLPNMAVERLPYNAYQKANYIEAGYYQDEKITGSSLGGLITAVTSST